VCPALAACLIEWTAVIDWLLTARFDHPHGHLSVIVAYAQTKVSCDAEKDSYYAQLESLASHTPAHDHLIILGNMNAVTGAIGLVSRPLLAGMDRGWRTTTQNGYCRYVHPQGSLRWVSGFAALTSGDGHGISMMAILSKILTTLSPGGETGVSLGATGPSEELKPQLAPTTALWWRRLLSRCHMPRPKENHPAVLTPAG